MNKNKNIKTTEENIIKNIMQQKSLIIQLLMIMIMIIKLLMIMIMIFITSQ